jgi:hypothetical protein
MLARRLTPLCFLALLSLTNAGFWDTEEEDTKVKSVQQVPNDDPVEYGVDVSFPIHHASISTNYAWLPHNVDTSIKTPKEYENMVVQPLDDKQAFYKDYIQGCVDHFGKRGDRCTANELGRVSMALRQPQSMQVRFYKHLEPFAV